MSLTIVQFFRQIVVRSINYIYYMYMYYYQTHQQIELSYGVIRGAQLCSVDDKRNYYVVHLTELKNYLKLGDRDLRDLYLRWQDLQIHVNDRQERMRNLWGLHLDCFTSELCLNTFYEVSFVIAMLLSLSNAAKKRLISDRHVTQAITLVEKLLGCERSTLATKIDESCALYKNHWTVALAQYDKYGIEFSFEHNNKTQNYIFANNHM